MQICETTNQLCTYDSSEVPLRSNYLHQVASKATKPQSLDDLGLFELLGVLLFAFLFSQGVGVLGSGGSEWVYTYTAENIGLRNAAIHLYIYIYISFYIIYIQHYPAISHT